MEALTGVELDVTHLDGRKLIIRTNPGDVVPAPPAIKPSLEQDFDTHKDSTCGGDIVARADMDQVRDVDHLKRVALEKGFNAFVIEGGSKVVFKEGSPELLRGSKKNKKGDVLYILSEPKQDMQKAVKNEGMPLAGNPFQHGHLFIQFDIKMPEELGEEAVAALKKYLPEALNKSKFAQELKKQKQLAIEEYYLSDIDAKKSLEDSKRNHRNAHDEDDDEDGHGPQGVQCAQQ